MGHDALWNEREGQGTREAVPRELRVPNRALKTQVLLYFGQIKKRN
jgi:hypothetical protein